MSLTERNELSFETKNNKPIPIEELSSGEKQLLIILAKRFYNKKNLLFILQMNPNYHCM